MADTIIIIDDDRDFQESLKLLLEEKGYQIFLAHDPEDVLNHISEFPHSVVLADISMPDISGITLLKEIKDKSPQSIVLLMTASMDIEKAREALLYGAFDYLTKPFENRQLFESLGKAMTKMRLTREKQLKEIDLQKDVDEITEMLKIQNEALEREQERTRGIIEEAHLGFLVLDGDSEEIHLLNKRLKHILHFEEGKDNYFLKNYREVFSKRITEILCGIIKKIKAYRKVMDFGDFDLGDELILNFTAYPIMIRNDLSSIVIAVQDITEKKMLEKQIIQSSRLADMGEMSAVIGHEINNPIAFVSSNTSTLSRYLNKLREYLSKVEEIEGFLESFVIDEDKILDVYQGVLSLNDVVRKKREDLKRWKSELKIPKILKNMEEIVQENLEGLVRVKNIVLDLKKFSYMGDESLEEADINQILEQTLNLVAPQIKYKATVTKDLGTLPVLKCFPRQISQVFANVLVNAAHSIENKGSIFLKSYYTENGIFIEIKDTGTGMDEDTRKKIFNPFFTTKKIGKGTGLGLSISYKIIEKHNGKISVNSEPGKGSVFLISLPLKQDKKNET